MGLHLSWKCSNGHTHLAERVKYRVEIHQYLALGHLRDVVQAFRREVSHPILGVREAYEQRFHELLHVRSDVDTQGDRGARETYQTSISHV